MAELKAKAAGGNWGSASTWEPEKIPTAEDDVKLNASSGNVTIAAAALCRSIDCTGYTKTLKWEAFELGIGDGTAGAGSIALKFVSGMTLTITNAITSQLKFNSTSATQQSIDFAGKTTGDVYFEGVGGNYKYLGEHKQGATANLRLIRGTLDTNGQTCVWGGFVSPNSTTRTLKLGASLITCLGTAWNFSNTSGLTFEPGTSKITCSGTGFTLTSAGFNFYDLVFNGAGTVASSSNFTCHDFTRTGTAVKTDGWSSSSSVITVTGTLTIKGNSTINRLTVISNVPTLAKGWSIANPAVFENADFADIAITGAGASANGTTLVGDAGGNSGILFTTAATQTRKGVAGNYSEPAKWTSRVPLPQDNVVIGSEASGTIGQDMPRMGKDIDCTGFAGTLNMGQTTRIYGSLTFSTGMTLTGANGVQFLGRSSHVITSNGKQFLGGLTFTNGGSYVLGDALSTTGALAVAVSTFNASTFNVTCASANFSNASAVVSLGTGTWSLTSTAAIEIWQAQEMKTLEAGTSTIVIANASANTRSFRGGDLTYYNLVYTVAGSTGILEVRGSNTFNSIEASDTTNGRTLTFTGNGTTTFTGQPKLSGTSGKLTTLESTISGTKFRFRKASGLIEQDYLVIKDSDVDAKGSGGARWLAGTHSEDKGNNVGWEFNVVTEVKKGGGTGSGSGSATGNARRRRRATGNSASSSGSVTVKVKRALRSGATGSSSGSAVSSGSKRIAVGGGTGSANTFASDISVRRRFGRAQGSGESEASGGQTTIFSGGGSGSGKGLALSVGVERHRRSGGSGAGEGSADSGDAVRTRSPGECRAQGDSNVLGEGVIIAVGGGVASGVSEASLHLVQDHQGGRAVLEDQSVGSAILEHDSATATIEREP